MAEAFRIGRYKVHRIEEWQGGFSPPEALFAEFEAQAFAQVVGSGDDLAVRHNHGSDGHFVQFGGTLGLLEGHAHEPNVVVGEWVGSVAHAVWGWVA